MRTPPMSVDVAALGNESMTPAPRRAPAATPGTAPASASTATWAAKQRSTTRAGAPSARATAAEWPPAAARLATMAKAIVTASAISAADRSGITSASASRLAARLVASASASATCRSGRAMARSRRRRSRSTSGRARTSTWVTVPGRWSSSWTAGRGPAITSPPLTPARAVRSREPATRSSVTTPSSAAMIRASPPGRGVTASVTRREPTHTPAPAGTPPAPAGGPADPSAAASGLTPSTSTGRPSTVARPSSRLAAMATPSWRATVDSTEASKPAGPYERTIRSASPASDSVWASMDCTIDSRTTTVSAANVPTAPKSTATTMERTGWPRKGRAISSDHRPGILVWTTTAPYRPLAAVTSGTPRMPVWWPPGRWRPGPAADRRPSPCAGCRRRRPSGRG